MKEENFCPLCNGSGYEKHKCVREDGEVVTEQICCELCGGAGKYKDAINKSKCVQEIRFFEAEMIQEKNSLLDYVNSDEDNYF